MTPLKSLCKNIHDQFMNGNPEPSVIFTHPFDVEMETLVAKELSRLIDDMQESNTINIGDALRRMYRAGMEAKDNGVVVIATKS